MAAAPTSVAAQKEKRANVSGKTPRALPVARDSDRDFILEKFRRGERGQHQKQRPAYPLTVVKMGSGDLRYSNNASQNIGIEIVGKCLSWS
jgi:hypothetical protein